MSADKSARTARSERVAAVRREQARRDRRGRLLAYGGGGVLLLAVVGGTGAVLVNHNRSADLTVGGVASLTEETGHVTTKVAYPQTPPAGGKHNPTWLNCGVYDKPVPNENAVHDLEHGAVWVTYRPDLPAAQILRLNAMARGRTYLTLSPYPGLPAPVVASAWGKQLRLASADDPRLSAFITTYKQSRTAPEPGAACTGGVGTPTP